MTISTLARALGAKASAVASRPAAALEREKAFQQLVAQHRTRLHRLVLRHIGHFDEAEDIAQEAFCEAARNFDRFRGESELSTWLYGIAMNLVRNYLNRAPYKLHRFEPETALEGLFSIESDPSAIVDSRQMMRRVSDSFGELSMEMQEVLKLVGVDEMSYEHAAARLSIPVGTVRSRLSRARAQLRSRLSSSGVDMTAEFSQARPRQRLPRDEIAKSAIANKTAVMNARPRAPEGRFPQSC